jgi:hypothetical protein
LLHALWLALALSSQARAQESRALSLHAAAGLGVGTLAFQRPTPQGLQILPQTPFAAAELLLRVRAWPGQRLSLETLLAYQTSLGLVLQTRPLFALPQNVEARWQRVELSAAPTVRLGAASDAPRLAFPVGLVLRSLFPGVHQFSVPNYRLGGFLLRAELSIALGRFISLRAGPEAQWLVFVEPSLRRAGACCQGVAIGGRAWLEAAVGPALRIALAYGESHAFAPIGEWRFMDIDRCLTARIAGEL